MVSNTIKASTITGAGVATIVFLIMLFSQAGDNPVGYCESTGKFCIAVDGFSSGQQTRCYNETDMNWWDAPYCKEGWQVVTNDLDINEYEEEIIPSKGQGRKYKCNSEGCIEIK